MLHKDHLDHRNIEATPGTDLELKSLPDGSTDPERSLGLAVSIDHLRACDVCVVFTENKIT
jgi:hypothetical protein